MASSIPATTTTGATVGMEIQPASDGSGTYVPVVALDPDSEITIGSVTLIDELPSGTNTIGLVNQGLGGTSAWKVDPSGVTSPVVIESMPSIPPGTNSIGTVVANAGTNLNTSGLAKESGGNLATLAGTVSDGNVQTVVTGALPAGSNTIGTVLPPAVTPRAATASTITTGGTAVTLVTGPINGGYITNPANAASQGIESAENAYVDLVSTPGSADAAANGTTVLLEPAQNFTLPPLTSGVTIKANAATSGHKLTVVVW